MSTIRVRRLDNNWDPIWGGGLNDYLTDADAVAQIIKSRMLFFKGEWWEDVSQGLPMWQSILGKMGSSKTIIDKLIIGNIKQCPYVVGIASFTSELLDREYVCNAVVNTQFGTIVVTNGG
jgi:hypothetical protein